MTQIFCPCGHDMLDADVTAVPPVWVCQKCKGRYTEAQLLAVSAMKTDTERLTLAAKGGFKYPFGPNMYCSVGPLTIGHIILRLPECNAQVIAVRRIAMNEIEHIPHSVQIWMDNERIAAEKGVSILYFYEIQACPMPGYELTNSPVVSAIN